MNVALRRAMTVDEYLAWSDTQVERQRTELINGQIVAMPSERLSHGRVKGNIYSALSEAVRAAGLPCEVLPDGPGVRIDDHTAYKPDALVFCGGTPGVRGSGPLRLDPPGLDLVIEGLLGTA